MRGLLPPTPSGTPPGLSDAPIAWRGRATSRMKEAADIDFDSLLGVAQEGFTFCIVHIITNVGASLRTSLPGGSKYR
eukprot:1194929-Prorocentrum_minimum.AAC.1